VFKIEFLETENEKLKNLLKLAGKLAIAAEYVINNNDMLDLGNRLNYLNKCLEKYNKAIVQEVENKNKINGE
jgi:mevalonate kinase